MGEIPNGIMIPDFSKPATLAPLKISKLWMDVQVLFHRCNSVVLARAGCFKMHKSSFSDFESNSELHTTGDKHGPWCWVSQMCHKTCFKQPETKERQHPKETHNASLAPTMVTIFVTLWSWALMNINWANGQC